MEDLTVDYSDVYNVSELYFSVLSPEEIINNSVVQVFNTELNEGSSLDTPRCNGVNDPRMGPPTGSTIICPTDDLTSKGGCPGYFGHIDLSKPVFWPQFMPIIQTLLRMVCYNCSHLLIDFEDERGNDRLVYRAAQRLKGRARYDRIKKKITPRKACPGCQAPQPVIKRENHTRVIAEFKQPDGGVKRVNFSAERVRLILARITDEDAEGLGFSRYYSRPEWFVCTVFPVAPPSIRPSSTRNDSSQRSEDDLTMTLLNIVKLNRELGRKLQGDVDGLDEYVNLLQFHVTSYVNSELAGAYKAVRKSGQPTKSIVSRFKGKTGRIRGNLMGKRANFSARSVITGDPTLSVEEVGVPYKIAMKLTYPAVSVLQLLPRSTLFVTFHGGHIHLEPVLQVVTEFNIEQLTQLVRNGPFAYPGANSYRKKGSKSTILVQLHSLWRLNQLDTVELQIGDVVNRHMLDGDLVLFNRQPSLHRWVGSANLLPLAGQCFCSPALVELDVITKHVFWTFAGCQ